MALCFNLSFQKSVKKYFSFLKDDYGYECISSEAQIVKYCTDKVYIAIYRDHWYELCFEIGLLPAEYNNPLRIDTSGIVYMKKIENPNLIYITHDEQQVEETIRKLAAFAKEYAVDALEGSHSFFDEVLKYKRDTYQFFPGM